jgi:hypothetical protein
MYHMSSDLYVSDVFISSRVMCLQTLTQLYIRSNVIGIDSVTQKHVRSSKIISPVDFVNYLKTLSLLETLYLACNGRVTDK